MNLWIFVMIIQYIVILLAWMSHALFIYFAIYRKNFNTYSRFCLGCVSFAMIDLTCTSGLAFFENLNHGTIVEDAFVSELPRRKLWLYIHSYGEFILISVECLSTVEKFLSILKPKFHNSTRFFLTFSLIVLSAQFGASAYIYSKMKSFSLFKLIFTFINFFELLNFVMLILLFYNSKKIYFKTRGNLQLRSRFQLSEAYRWCQCLLPSAIFSTICKIFLFLYSWFAIFVHFDNSNDSYFYFIMDLIINSVCMIFPWTILLAHPIIKKELVILFGIRSRRVGLKRNSKIRSINGKIINPTFNQAEYFDQLKNSWN